MKIAGLIIGILLTILSFIGLVVCLLLPTMTNNRVGFDEALLGLIPAVFFLIIGLVITIISAIFVMRARKKTK